MSLLSPSELDLIHNQEIILAKRKATGKIRQVLEGVEQALVPVMNKFTLPEEVAARSGKISSGENYLGLPYLVLDYPRLFSRSSVFAFRTMFWWGNFFSGTLHIGGKSFDLLKPYLRGAISDLKDENLYFAIGDDPWQYHYEITNYQLLTKLVSYQIDHYLDHRKFIKLSKKWSLQDYQVLYQEVPILLERLLNSCGFMAHDSH